MKPLSVEMARLLSIQNEMQAMWYYTKIKVNFVQIGNIQSQVRKKIKRKIMALQLNFCLKNVLNHGPFVLHFEIYLI